MSSELIIKCDICGMRIDRGEYWIKIEGAPSLHQLYFEAANVCQDCIGKVEKLLHIERN